MISSFDQLDLRKTYSYADYLRWQFKERVELLKGKVVKMSPAPSRRHQEIVVSLTLALGNYFKKRPCSLFVAPFDVQLVPDNEKATVVQPDLCVVCDPQKLTIQGCKGAPDLMVEVLSPGNSAYEMDRKFDAYEEAGVKEYWILDPSANTVLIFCLNEKAKFAGLKPIVKGQRFQSKLFPELTIDTNDIFD